MKFALILSFLVSSAVGSSQNEADTLTVQNIDFQIYCDHNFSSTKKDPTFSNFYISNSKDTVFFKSANCLVSIETTSPLTFRRRIVNGWAEGYIELFQKMDSTYSWTKGEFKDGILTDGSFYEFYNNHNLKLTGQYIHGQRHGVWTWYFESQNIQTIATLRYGAILEEIEYDIEGNIIQ